MAKVFISGSDVQRAALFAVRQDLQDLGFDTKAHWLDRGDPALLPNNAQPTSGEYAQAQDRWFDLMESDIIVVFDVTPTCMLEVGAAKALAHRIIAVGLDKDHDDAGLFLPDVIHYSTYDEARQDFFEKPRALRVLRRDK